MSCRSREPQASDKEWMLGIPNRNGRNGCLKQTCQANLLSAVRLFLRTWAADHNSLRDQTLCFSAWDRSVFSEIWVQKIYDEESFESITDSWLKHRPWRSSWIVTPNSIIQSYRLSDLLIHELNVFARKKSGNGVLKPTNMSHRYYINLLSAVNIGSWKADSSVSNPLLLKAQSRHFFIASWLFLHGNVGPTFARCHDASTNGLGDHKPKRSKKSNRNFTVTGMSMSCLDRARTANVGYRKFIENLRRRIIRIYHWFMTQTSTLAFELDCDSQLNNSPTIHPYWLSDLFMSWMSLLERIAGIWREWIPWTNVSKKSLFRSESHLENIGSWKAGSSTSNPLLLKAECVRFFMDLRNILQSKSWIPQLYLLHAWCKHLQRRWSVLPLSGTSSFLVGNRDNSSLLRGLF